MKKVARITAGLQDPSVLNFIRQMDTFFARSHQIEEASRRITAGLQDPSVLNFIRQMDTFFARSHQIEEASRRITAGLQDPSVLNFIRQMDTFFARSHQIEEASRRIIAGLQDPSVLKSIRQMDTFFDSARLTAMALQESPAMQAIREFSNSPFNPAVKEVVFSELDSLDTDHLDLPEDQDFAIDQDIQLEIERELEGSCDYNSLSEKTKSLLVYIYNKYLRPFFISCLAAIVVTDVQKLQIRLQDKETPAEIRSYLRKPIPEINKELLKGHRVITGSDVNLRKEPSMKSEVITKLPLGKLIEVLDKSNRSWLLVEVDIEEEAFVGWVSRRYTIYFK